MNDNESWVVPRSQWSMTDQAPKSVFGATLWVGVAALVPLERFVATQLDGRVPYLVLAIIIGCLLFVRIRMIPGAKVWLLFLVMVPIAGAIAGSASSVPASLAVAVKMALLGAAPFIFAYYLQAQPWVLASTATAFLSTQSISAFVGLLQLTGMTVLGTRSNAGRANGLAGHPNVLGVMAAIAVLVALAVAARRGRPWNIIAAGVAAVNLAALIGTGSLSALLALAAGAGTWLYCLRKRLRSLAHIAATSAAICLVLVALGYSANDVTDTVSHRIGVVTGEIDGVASLRLRQLTWQFAWQQIGEDPVVGWGMDSTNEGTYDGRTVVHNYVLHAWYQGGLILALIIVAVTAVCICTVASCIRRREFGTEAGVIALVLTFAATSAFFDQQQYWLPLMLALTVIQASSSAPAQAGRHPAASTARQSVS